MVKLAKALLTGSVIFFVLSGVTSVLNYAFYPVIAHFAGVELFGEIQFFLTLLNQFGVGFMVLNILSIIITVNKKHEKELVGLNNLSNLVVLGIAVVGSAVLIVCMPLFQITSVWPILMLGISMLAHIPYTIELGRLQGNGQFAFSGIVAISAAFMKLAFAILFIVIGLGAAGAILGYSLGLVLAYLMSLWWNKALRIKKPVFGKTFLQDIRFVTNRKGLLVAALATMSVLMVLSTIDVVVLKTVLGEVEMGQYAGISTVAKIILAMATPLMWLAAPRAVGGDMRTVRKFFLITLGLTITAAAGCLITKGFIIGVVFGLPDNPFLQLMPLALLSAVLFSLAIYLGVMAICRVRLRLSFGLAILAPIFFGVAFFVMSGEGEIVRRVLLSQIAAASVALVTLVVGLWKDLTRNYSS